MTRAAQLGQGLTQNRHRFELKRLLWLCRKMRRANSKHDQVGEPIVAIIASITVTKRRINFRTGASPIAAATRRNVKGADRLNVVRSACHTRLGRGFLRSQCPRVTMFTSSIRFFCSSAIDLGVVPGLSSDRRIDGLLYVAEPVHRSLENGHCMVSLTRGHCLQIYIELECPIVFVN
jgi:hypothetical protein